MANRFHVATRKGLFTIHRGNAGWAIERASFLGDNCTLVMHDPRPELGSEGTLYAALDHGHFGVKLHRSVDGGVAWQEIATPVYPEKPADYVPKTPPMEGQAYDWVLKLVWALSPGGSEQKGRIWCGTLPGGLFFSDDHGDSWELNRPLWDHPQRESWFGGGADYPGIHSICVNPLDPDHLTIGISCAGAWITRDCGQSWNCGGEGMRAEFMPPELAMDPNIQDPHLLVQCPAEPDALWVQHHNGIFKSTDAAGSWTEIEEAGPSTFGFAVAVHPKNPETAWFVPAVKDEQRIPADGKVVVTRTRDGGQSFDTLSKGLPQEHAYDLVFRHALDVDDSGDCLAFGSTTGSLWVSEDGGDSWETVSEHLPPIHAVRFEKGLL
ncbi:MAG: exo-alpha-sialidase [Verrucomicrobiae bacterium]|nr:exo-alpha-sialidase [Verrucomicrobiae bacterium]